MLDDVVVAEGRLRLVLWLGARDQLPAVDGEDSDVNGSLDVIGVAFVGGRLVTEMLNNEVVAERRPRLVLWLGARDQLPAVDCEDNDVNGSLDVKRLVIVGRESVRETLVGWAGTVATGFFEVHEVSAVVRLMTAKPELLVKVMTLEPASPLN